MNATREPLVGLAERLRASVTYAYMPMAVRRQLHEAATALEEQSRRVAELEAALCSIAYEAEREQGGWVHLKRAVAVAARTVLSPSDTVEKGEGA